MKQNFFISHVPQTICSLFIIFVICFLTVAGTYIPAEASGTGWVEITTTAPEELNNYLILSLVHDETQEEYDFPVLKEDNFHLSEKVPVGTYTVAGAWVYQDYRYKVTADVESLDVKDSTFTPINLTVTFTEEDGSESTETDEQSSEDWLVEKIEGLTEQALHFPDR